MKGWILTLAAAALVASLLVAAASMDRSDRLVPASRDIFPKVLDGGAGTRDEERGTR